MTTRLRRSALGKLVLVLSGAAVLGSMALTPAHADGDDWHHGHHDRDWHDHDGWRGDYHPPYVYAYPYAYPGYVYAPPPPVVYAPPPPPPPVVYAPPSLDIVVPIHIR